MSTSLASGEGPAAAAESHNGSGVVVRLMSISKQFGGVQALHDVPFDVRAGEVHALIGENGAGKSTLVKCLAGAASPDAGSIEIDSTEVHWTGPGSAIAAGIRVVYQELSLFPALTVAENIHGGEGLQRRWVRWSELRSRAGKHLRSLGLEIDPTLRVEQLPVGVQQMVEIARALFSGARVIVLDEPTSALSPRESERLFTLVGSLKARGVAFVLVTHFLEDVAAHADRVTVLRNGRHVRNMVVSETTKQQLVGLMVGADQGVLRATYEGDAVRLPARSSAPPILSALDVHAAPSVRGISLELGAGEVLGLYGDLSSGHFDFADVLFGVRSPERGALSLAGDPRAFRTPTAARDNGVGFLPADRRAALALDQSIARNITLAQLHRVQGRWLSSRRERELAERLIGELGVTGGRAGLEVGALSGGNQQKVLLARWLVRPPRLLVMVEPTRGMDVGAKSEVIRIVRRLAQEGTGVLVVSAEPETVLAMADRVLVARRGRIQAEFAGCALTKDKLLEEAS